MTPTLLVAENVSKRFGTLQANDRINLELRGGEVHALLGQNGAGKSTLVSIITGRFAPDEGRIVIDGRDIPTGDPHASVEHGIATVFQELMLVPSMTGLENIGLALRESANRTLRKRIEAVQTEYTLAAPLDIPVRNLEMPQRQRIALTRALAQKPRVLLLDEPTSLLSPTAVAGFLEKVRELAESGIAILLITHRLDEARTIADRLTVLRHGRNVASHDRSTVPSNSDLAMEMLGVRLVDEIEVSEPQDQRMLVVADLSAVNESKQTVINNVSFEVRAGEIVGIAGVDGNGQFELLEAIAGLRHTGAGRVELEGTDLTALSYRERFERGVKLVSGDRQRHGIIPTFSISDHFEYALGRETLTRLPSVLSDYDVRPSHPRHRGDQLSGGNQQKMIVAAACEQDPKLLLLAYPTRGLDVQASLKLREVLVSHARRGVTILITSSDLEELLSISHRIVVMNRGRIVGTQHREAIDHQQLAEWFTASDDETRGNAA
ncbi:MAG: ATP-binding cassette domain-containing protein [Thermoleophilia bacterium]|nr:ATP-binding cassette domain-containing protein [Thermoleophilia bacterium]